MIINYFEEDGNHEMTIETYINEAIEDYIVVYGKSKEEALKALKDSIKETIKDLEKLLETDIDNIIKKKTRGEFY